MITFKQFIAEEREIHAKKIEGAPAWSPAVAEGDYKIGDITFSAGNGFGSVPHNQNVWYVGIVVFMKPSTFMTLALDDQGSQEPTSLELEKLAKEGYAVGIPFLDVKFDPAGKVAPKIMGHEGRGRMRMVRRVLGDEPIPVHLILRDGLRSRDVTKLMVQQIKSGMYAEQSDTLVKNPVTAVYVDHTKSG